MPNITRIKSSGGSDKPKKDESADSDPKVIRATVKSKTNTKSKISDQKTAKQTAKKEKSDARAEKNAQRKGFKKFLWFVFTGRFVTVPVMAFAYYIRNSWREILQVRWPDRKLTWKLTVSVLVYTFLIGAFIMLLDMAFNILFEKILV